MKKSVENFFQESAVEGDRVIGKIMEIANDHIEAVTKLGNYAIGLSKQKIELFKNVVAEVKTLPSAAARGWRKNEDGYETRRAS